MALRPNKQSLQSTAASVEEPNRHAVSVSVPAVVISTPIVIPVQNWESLAHFACRDPLTPPRN